MSEGMGKRVARLRKGLGLTQQKLSFEAQVDPSTISRLELEKLTPDTSTLQKIADALGVTLVELVGDSVPGAAAPHASLQRFLERYPDMAVSPDERAWLQSQRFPERLGDIGTDEWWASQLFAYRGLVARAPAPEARAEPNSPSPRKTPAR